MEPVRQAEADPPRSYIGRKDGVCGGKPIIVGTRIRVSLVATEHEEWGWSADEIVQAHPHLTLAQVHSALAYYYDHLDQIQDEWRETERLVAEMRRKYPSSVLEERLGGRPHLPR